MSGSTGVAVYRALLRLYPRPFREEYGADMVLLLQDQLRDEPGLRVCARAVIDLAVTVPTRRLEAHVNRLPHPVVPLLFAVVAVAGLFVAAVGGSSRGTLVVGLSVAAVAGSLAAVARRHTRPLALDRPTSVHWWKFLGTGAALLAAVVAVTTATGEVDSSLWWPMMIAVLCAVALVVVGVALGIARTGSRPLPTP